MRGLFGKKKFFLAIIIAILITSLIIGTEIYLFQKIFNRDGIIKENTTNNTPDYSNDCLNIPELPDESKRLVTKIIDGDTFLIEGGYSVRILGIDTDERGYDCYESAKNKLEELILNKEVRLEKGGKDFDQYCRYLRYVFLDDQNIGLEIIKEGLGVARFSPEDTKYRKEIEEAEKEARNNKIGCKWSSLTDKNKEEYEYKEFQWDKLTPEKTGLKLINACQAGDYYGKEVLVEGKIVDTYRSKTNTIFLNFEKAYPNQCFSGVIFSSNLYKFVQKPEEYYRNKIVRIMGKVKKYNEKPEIILENTNQIEVGK